MAQLVADFVWDRLRAWGVKRVFGYPGDGINGLMGALDRTEGAVEFVQVRHEEMAGLMACATAKFTGEVGVCIATSGPGAIHLLNGLYDARLDHQPVPAIVGQQARSALGGHYQQEVDLQTLFKDVAGAFVQQASVPEQIRHLVDRAMRIAMDPEGIGLSRRRITLSTSGVVPMMDRCGAELGVNLAVSLHAVRDDLRDEIVPLNRKYPIAELIAACRRYPGASNARRITFEYIMLRGVNDSEAEARELVRLIAGIPAKVNLIPFNPWPGSDYRPSGREALERFAAIVQDAGFASPIRMPRGQDILAACGQLRTDSRRTRPAA